MTIKARPFKTEVGEAEVEGFFEQSNFVFRFYGVAFHVPVISIEEDSKGTFAALEETERFSIPMDSCSQLPLSTIPTSVANGVTKSH
jgi:hypothetical protein